MQLLFDHLQNSEDRIINRLTGYAEANGYTKNSSTLAEAWPMSVAGLTASFKLAVEHSGEIQPPCAESEPADHPIGAFALQAAKNHRSRGVTPGNFLGLFKCYRQSYLEEIDTLRVEQKEDWKRFFHRFCDRLEVLFCNEWLNQKQPDTVSDLQQANLNLANEKNLYMTLLQSLKEPVFWVDEELTIQYVNKAGAEMLDIPATPESIRFNSLSAEQRVVGLPFPWLREELRRTLKGKKSTLKTTLTLKGEEKSHYKLITSPMVDVSNKFTGLAIVVENYTPLQHAREARAESEKRLRAYFDSSHEGIAIHELIYDEKGEPVDYRIVEANQAFTEHTGIPLDEALSKDASQLYGMSPAPYLSLYAQVAREGKPEQFEVYFEPFNRHYLIKAISLDKDQFVTIFSDITARVISEQELKDAIKIRRSIIRATPSALGFVDSFDDRKLIWVNQKMCTLLGYSKADLIGNPARMIYPEDGEYERIAENLSGQLEKKDFGTIETSWVTKSGEKLCILLNYAPIQRDDLAQGIVFTGHDITENKRMQLEQKRLEKQLQFTQKLESLGVLAGGIAHDFNNILVAILGNAELALVELPSHSTVRPFLKDVVKASRRAGELCRQLLAYSGKGRFVIERMHLQDVIEDMTNMLEVSIAKNAVLRFRFADDVPPVEADATQLRQIIMNLVINASEAIESRSGIISISTGAMDCTADYLHTTFINENLSPGVYSYIEVSDTGVGMDKQTCEKLFEPFFTTKFSGRGLGMSAVLGIVRGHKGAIKVYSEPSRGTTIKMLLPATAGIGEETGVLESYGGAWQAQGIILLVDDEETVLAVTKKILENFGFTVITAENGKVAVDIFTKRCEEIAVVLMDLTMPKLDGEAAFSQMKVIKPDARIILSSGYNEQELSERFSGKRTSGFIQKPYRIEELRETMQALLG